MISWKTKNQEGMGLTSLVLSSYTTGQGQGQRELGDQGSRGAHEVLGEAVSGLLHAAPGSMKGL